MSEDRKSGPGIRTKPQSIRDKTTAVNEVAKRGAEKARFAQRRADVQPDESKPEGDAVGTVEETEQQLAEDAERTGKVLLRHAGAASRKKREAAQALDGDLPDETTKSTLTAENTTTERGNDIGPDGNQKETTFAVDEESTQSRSTEREATPRRNRQDRSKLKRRDAIRQEADNPAGTAKASTDEVAASEPGNRVMSADELQKARDRIFGNARGGSVAQQDSVSPAADAPPTQDGTPLPRVRQEKAEVYHSRPSPQTPRQREILREPVAGSRVIESAPRVEIRTADVGGKAAGNAANAAADAAKQKVADEVSRKAAQHMKELSKKAAERSAKALKESAKAALRAVEAAGKALVNAIMAGGWVVVVIILVILMCASILASPFGIFTHTDSMEHPDSYTLDKAITTINEEYVGEVKKKAKGSDNVSILIEGNIEGDIEPVNWVDVLGVFAVHVTMREENAMNVVDLDEAQLKELRSVFWDMNQITVERETEDGETTTYVLGKALTYKDMYVKYHFTQKQIEMIEELMSDEYYAFWSNFVGTSMGHVDDDWTGVSTAPDDEGSDYSPTFSGGSMKIPKIYQYNYKQTVCRINGENKSASSSGCGAASMCMVIHYLTGNTKPTPYTLFKWCYEKGYYNGSGLDHSVVSAMGKLYGVTGSWVGKDGEKIVKALTSGYPVIAHMGPGVFTKGGHYIVLRGVTKDGKILVNDPASSSRTSKAWPLSTILKQGKTSTPFMICSKK